MEFQARDEVVVSHVLVERWPSCLIDDAGVVGGQTLDSSCRRGEVQVEDGGCEPPRCEEQHHPVIWCVGFHIMLPLPVRNLCSCWTPDQVQIPDLAF